MKWAKLFLCSYLLALSFTGMAQADPPVSIADTAKVNSLISDSKKLFGSDPDKALSLSLEAKTLAEKIKFPTGEAYALKNIGIVWYNKRKYEEALQNYNQSLAIFQNLKDNVGIANLLSNIGVIYYDRGDDKKALEYYLQASRYADISGDKMRKLTVLNNVGGVYFMKKHTYDKALEYYLQALPLSEELKSDAYYGNIATNVGSIYYLKNEDGKAVEYFNKALKAYKGSEESLNAYNGLGKLYLRQKNYDLALQNHNRALTLAKKGDDKLALVQTLAGLGSVYKQMKEYNTSLSFYHQAEAPALEIEANHELIDLYDSMALTYASIQDYKQAFRYQDLYTQKSAEQYNIDNDKLIAGLQFSHDLEIKQNQINLLTKDKDIQDLQLKKQETVKKALIAGLIMIVVIVFVLYRGYHMKVLTNKVLDRKNLQIENLLLNILPAEVAHELQATGKATPRNYESVSVLFTDFKSFTTIADKMSPQELVQELNSAFIAFDDIIVKHNLEKIKTIGDSYMCAGGIPTPDDQHIFNMVKASLEIQEYVFRHNQERKEKGLVPWDIRIGINVGPVVAGVVGRKKYAYDIWGSTVNVASRMESSGMPGQVNISAAVYELIKEKYACIYRGKIYAKNVGEIDMYFIDYEIENFKGYNSFEEAEPSKNTTAVTDNILQDTNLS